jgi:mono/diheme cytochrome c family protein
MMLKMIPRRGLACITAMTLVTLAGAAVAETPTYSADVAHIMEEKCVSCHRPDGGAPVSFTSYRKVMNYAPMIREVIDDGRMPPWHSDDAHGKFINDRRLTDAEKETLFAWIDGDTPEGDPAHLPAPKTYESDWRIGDPDMVFDLPKTVDVPADGVMPYLYFETPTNFTEDRWIQAAEAKPGNPNVVHHIIVFCKEQREQGGGIGVGRGFVDGYAPGDSPMMLPPNVGLKLPAGGTLVWQMHYTPTGRAERDRSQFGIRFCKEKPAVEMLTGSVLESDFVIPAGAENHRVSATMRLREDVTVLSMTPHMHLRGKSFDYTAVLPDGTQEDLLSVPAYDFNWQTSYKLAEPRFFPAGTRIRCVAHYDNSEKNFANPDPEKSVRWGDQTWEEMMIGFFSYIPGDARKVLVSDAR